MTSPTIAADLAGLAPVNGLQLYYESYGNAGAGGTPLILLHGGFGLTGMFGDLPARLAEDGRSSPSTCRVTVAPLISTGP